MGDFLNDPLFFAGALLLGLLLLRQAAWLVVSRSGRLVLRSRQRFSSSALRARAHPLRAGIEARFPRFFAWLAARLDPQELSGLPLTLLVLALGYTGFLIGGVVEELLEAEEIISTDRAVDSFFSPYRREPLLDIFIWITDLGGSVTLAAIALVTTVFFWACRRSHLVLPIWITIVGAEAATWLGKWVFDRGRPEFVTAVAPVSASFPSAHAAGAMAVYGFAAYALVIGLPGLRERFETVYWTLALIFLIGLSRVFLGVHYASDVAAGWLVGFFWLLVGIAVAERQSGRN